MTALDGAASPSAVAPSTSPETSAPEIMRADQLAAFLGLNRNTVYEYAARGVIPHRRIGRRIVFARVHVMAWLDDSKRKGLEIGGRRA